MFMLDLYDLDLSQQRGHFKIIRPLDKTRFLVRRELDFALFIASPFAPEASPETRELAEALSKPGAAENAQNIYNHENLISMAGGMIEFDHGGGREGTRYILWDACDAGNLDNVFRHPPVEATPSGFLGESLCWHVTISVLRALSWLHDGTRFAYRALPLENGQVELRYEVTVIQEDWVPILHRAIEPKKIFFQKHFAKNTYGLCKLGNYSNLITIKNKLHGVPVTTETGRGDMTDLINVWKSGVDTRAFHSNQRPYTTGSEAFALAAVVWRMMTGKILPGVVRCECGFYQIARKPGPCAQPCTEADDVFFAPLGDKNKYSRHLKNLVVQLLKLKDTDMTGSQVMRPALSAYADWRQDTREGRAYVDVNEHCEPPPEP